MKNKSDLNLKRIIVDFKKLTPEILALVIEKFPDGYDDMNIIKFKNTKGEVVEAVEIITVDTKYLVKVDARLEKVMEDYEEDDYDAFENDDPNVVQDLFEESEDLSTD
jgi:hypothetical protein